MAGQHRGQLGVIAAFQQADDLLMLGHETLHVRGWGCRTDAGQADEGAELIKELRQGLHAGDPSQPSMELLVELHELLTGPRLSQTPLFDQ